MAVPRAMLSTMVRSGFTISSPAKPMLFQASELNREPVMARPMAVTRAATGEGRALAGGVEAGGLPDVLEVLAHGLVLDAQKQARQNQQGQGHELGAAEDVGNQLARAHTPRELM